VSSFSQYSGSPWNIASSSPATNVSKESKSLIRLGLDAANPAAFSWIFSEIRLFAAAGAAEMSIQGAERATSLIVEFSTVVDRSFLKDVNNNFEVLGEGLVTTQKN
jgi:hypothetical protein